MGLLGSMMFIPPNTSLFLDGHPQENQKVISFITAVSGDSQDSINSNQYSTMKQIHLIVKESSPYLGIFALLYGIINDFLDNQDNSDGGSHLPIDKIPTKDPGYGDDYSKDSNDNFLPLDEEKLDPKSNKNDDLPTLSDTDSQITDFYFEDNDYISSNFNAVDKCSFDCSLSTLVLDKKLMSQILRDGYTIKGDIIEVQQPYQNIPVQIFILSLYDTANSFFVQELYYESREYLKKIVDITPHNASLYANIAVTYFNESEYDLALDYANKALNIDPRNNKALGLKSWILAELGYYQDSELVGNVALGLNPINTDVLMSKIVITSNMNKLEISDSMLLQP